ncbi:carboxymuconolactone decarboxylase family protein [Desulfovibrio sp.]|uniref:carboxymuconolactone decarboxylase family protein n=1 Tax=Desulfovibrio sp. TaxID=885 RepID=UPI0023D62FFA|nr:carboxymuconolactone decarboxylase family protein [Desulfovibrio sp.]MDE7242296.1 carboxymuconolactone decarboxylase family protein [Desulfovibrio sp.]
MKNFVLSLVAGALLLALASPVFAAGRLDRRGAAIVPIAALTALGDQAALARALEAGLDSGLTVNDIKEVLIQLYAYCGFPRSLDGLNTFMGVVEKRKKAGKNDPEGEQPRPLPAGADRKAIGSATQTALLGRPADAPVYAFALGIDQFLKEHLFCDIFSRGVLSAQERELATIAALAALPAYGQLKAHLGFSLNTGLTPEQLDEAVVILTEKAGEAPGMLARATLEKMLAERQGK